MPQVSLKNLEKRHQTWFAKVRVPADLRDVLGRSVFIQTTGESDPVRAALRARPIIAEWHDAIRKARRPLGEGFRDNIMARDDLPPAAKRAILEEQGIPLPRFTDHQDAWKADLKARGMKPRQVDQYAADLLLYTDCDTSLALAAVTSERTRQWAEDRQKAGDSLKTVQRRLAALRNYWGFLQDRKAVNRDLPSPFTLGRLRDKAPPTAKSDKRVAFTAAEVVQLWKAAKPGSPMADLIILGAHTGGRIEELFRLRLSDISLDKTDTPITLHLDSKTDAGDRLVPVTASPILLGTLKRLMGEAGARDGYILPSTAKNQYGERSQAMGQKFGRLKTAQGFGPGHVFHSIRKTVATLLQNVACPEHIAADILGHKLNTMSYGVYSSGATTATKLEWLAKAVALYQWPQVPEATGRPKRSSRK